MIGTLHEYRSITGNPKWWADRTKKRGGGNSRGKLSDDSVREIRRLAAEGISNIDLAKKFGVTPKSISKIKTRESYVHVD